MTCHATRISLTALTLWVASLTAFCSMPVTVEGSVGGGAGNGAFAPYYIASNNYGITPQTDNLLLGVALHQDYAKGNRFSYEWGAEAFGGYNSSATYLKYGDGGWQDNPQHPARIWLQQLYAGVRYRSLFLTVGMKKTHSALLNDHLSSGDYVEGCNARPIPQVRIGFNDFQPIPFTNGWIEIQGEISYGKMTDNAWIRNHFNYYNSLLCTGKLYTYKRCLFRSKSSMPFSVTAGMQIGAFFGGTTSTYEQGQLIGQTKNPAGIKEFLKMFIPTDGDEDYYLGSTLGCWDIHLRYNTPWGNSICAYHQRPWETGSGISFLNGFDGLWGLEYKNESGKWLTGAVIEYLDFTNQSGPIHYDGADLGNDRLPYHLNGADDYYNNFYYGPYANYGMSLGTPVMKSPIYNLDGYSGFTCNRIRGFHTGLTGQITTRLDYRLLAGYRKGWGTPHLPLWHAVDDLSMMLEATYVPPVADNKLTINAKIAFDHGNMYGDTFGAFVSVKYQTSFSF
ncbi:MAG: capsule assembly Wzi family protein [Muribaculaceae bacterium]|nr:capsule assembly Wzi family protein [Muribaculaceae bacterium]